jgi:hypothetical protein
LNSKEEISQLAMNLAFRLGMDTNPDVIESKLNEQGFGSSVLFSNVGAHPCATQPSSLVDIGAEAVLHEKI